MQSSIFNSYISMVKVQSEGVPLTEPSLGMMIAIGKNYIYAGMWWMVVFPGATLIGLVVGINLFADWLREELNPKLLHYWPVFLT